MLREYFIYLNIQRIDRSILQKILICRKLNTSTFDGKLFDWIYKKFFNIFHINYTIVTMLMNFPVTFINYWHFSFKFLYTLYKIYTPFLKWMCYVKGFKSIIIIKIFFTQINQVLFQYFERELNILLPN